MFSLRTIICTFLALYAITVIFMLQGRYPRRELPSIPEKTEFLRLGTTTTHREEYKFIHPPLAYKILSQLDAYQPIDGRSTPKAYSRTYLGLKRDDDYCDNHRAYFVEHPESVFEQKNIVHGWLKHTFIGYTVASLGNDMHSHNIQKMTIKEREYMVHDIQPQTNSFFTASSLSFYLDINKHASCLSQQSNHIPGCGKLSKKDQVAQAAATYIERFQDRTHCLNYDKFFPQTWILSDRLQCKTFFEKLLSPEYAKLQEERKIVYMKKISNSHRGEGVHPFNKEEEIKLRKQYKDGALCGMIKKDVLMQHYIHNSLLINGHKFDFRMYLLVASVNPIMAYYHDGFLRVSLAKYDAASDDRKVLLTNLALNKQIYDDAKKGFLYEGKDEEELKNAQQWSFDQLQAHLLENGIISDPNWLDNYLRPEFKKALIHLVRMSSDTYSKHSSFYGLYGVDFMLDTNLNLWFIEANAGPAFDGYSRPMAKFIAKMLTDHFEIVFGLLRSRMKRVVNFVNDMIEEGVVRETVKGGVVIPDFEQRKAMFDNITRNYFEKEFEISADNGFAKIIDEHEEGVNVYQGFITQECL